MGPWVGPAFALTRPFPSAPIAEAVCRELYRLVRPAVAYPSRPLGGVRDILAPGGGRANWRCHMTTSELERVVLRFCGRLEREGYRADLEHLDGVLFITAREPGGSAAEGYVAYRRDGLIWIDEVGA